MPILIRYVLSDALWDPHSNGWTADILRMPEAAVQRLECDGKYLPEDMWEQPPGLALIKLRRDQRRPEGQCMAIVAFGEPATIVSPIERLAEQAKLDQGAEIERLKINTNADIEWYKAEIDRTKAKYALLAACASAFSGIIGAIISALVHKG